MIFVREDVDRLLVKVETPCFVVFFKGLMLHS
jgi:hypothetical protein